MPRRRLIEIACRKLRRRRNKLVSRPIRTAGHCDWVFLLLLVFCSCPDGAVDVAQARTLRLEWRAGTAGSLPEEGYPLRLSLAGSDKGGLLLSGPPHTLFIYRHSEWSDRLCTNQINLPADTLGGVPLAVDLDGDSEDEIVVSLLRAGRASLRAYAVDGDVVWSSVELDDFGRTPAGREPCLRPLCVIDAAQGRRLVCGLDSGRNGFRRGVVAFDLGTGGLVWSLPLAAIPFRVAVDDFQGGDGIPEIALGTYSPDNSGAAPVRGFNSGVSLLLVIDSDGALQWEREVGGAFTWNQPRAVDLDGNGENEICVLRSASGQDTTAFAEVQVRDPDQGDLLRTYAATMINTDAWHVMDLDGDTDLEILLGLQHGEIAILDHHLRTVRRAKITPFPILEIEVVDIGEDGNPEFFCRASNFVAVVDRNLQVLSRGSCPAVDLLPRAPADQWAGMSFIGVDRLVGEIDLIRPPFPVVHFAAGGAVSLLLLGAGIAGVRALRSMRRTRAEAHWDLFRLEMREFWHGEESRNLLRDLIRFLHSLGRASAADAAKDLELRAQETAARFLATAESRVQSIFRRGAALGILIPGGGGAGRAGARLAAIRAIADVKKDETRYGSRLRSGDVEVGLRAARWLDAALSGFRARLKEHDASDAVAEIQQAIHECLHGEQASEHPLHGGTSGGPSVDSRVSIHLDARGSPRVFAQPGVVRTVLLHLFRNAVDAARDRETAIIEVTVETDPIHTQIRVRDNGCGIKESDRERIFDAGVTTKGDLHGHGLRLCREWLAPYRGTIRVLESEVGVGSTFEVRVETAE